MHADLAFTDIHPRSLSTTAAKPQPPNELPPPRVPSCATLCVASADGDGKELSHATAEDPKACLRRRHPGDLTAMVRYLNGGGDVNRVVSGLTLLQWACSWSDATLVQLLLDRDASVQGVSTGALSQAVRSARPLRTMPQLLLRARAEGGLEQPDPQGQTALMHAVQLARCNPSSTHGAIEPIDVVGLLLAAKADPQARDARLKTPLTYAWPNLCLCAGEDGHVAQLLVMAGADVEERRDDGCTLLLWAAKRGCHAPAVAMADFCLQHGARHGPDIVGACARVTADRRGPCRREEPQSEALGSTQKHSEALRSNQNHSEAPRSNQNPTSARC